TCTRGQDLRDEVMAKLNEFTGTGWDQEDDITMVTLERLPYAQSDFEAVGGGAEVSTQLADFNIPSEPGNERLAMKQVADVVGGAGLSTDRLEKLKTAVAEATMNAIEHGNENNPDLNVHIVVESS